jgi:starch phosphorylase
VSGFGSRGDEVPYSVLVTTRFGNVPLYMIEPYRPEHRWITRRLYEAGSDVRIAQEMLLGIGGVRALNWLGFDVSTYHFNEGHAVFAGVELLAERMAGGLTFPEAWEDTRRHIVFTTHTPVPAGTRFTPSRTCAAWAHVRASGAEMRDLGDDPFNMTVAGLRLARRANAVSALHGETARAMWANVDKAAPIVSITNGVRRATWQAPAIAAAKDASSLREARLALRRDLAAEVERRGGRAFDPEAMVIGVARRAAAYKRGDLILRDEERLETLMETQALHIVFSGKAHPDDANGQAIVARLARAQQEHPGRVWFLENYDLALARLLTRGCDVWLNHPIRPLEACGTSGMKAAANGALNLSILDGWWAEACEHR